MPLVVSPAAVARAPSPLMLSDHLITLAKACDTAGLRACAGSLVSLACSVLEEAPAH